MDANGFKNLCQFVAARIPNADTKISENAFELSINGVEISLFFNPLITSDRIDCYVDIGNAPDHGREEVFSRLLSMNLLSGTKTSGVYGFDLESEKIIFSQQIIYPDLMDPDELATLLAEYGAHAKSLQQVFLNPQSTSPLSSGLIDSFQTNSSFLA